MAFYFDLYDIHRKNTEKPHNIVRTVDASHRSELLKFKDISEKSEVRVFETPGQIFGKFNNFFLF